MRRVVVALACAVVAAVLPSPARAQAPTNGQLAVVQRDRILTVNADGSALRTLYAPDSGDAITDPAWSPDGNKLAFVYQRKIALLDLTSSSVVFLTEPGPASDREPTWSVDGSLIGFRRDGVTQRRLKVGTSGLSIGVVFSDRKLDIAPDAFALAPDLDNYAYRAGTWLEWTRGGPGISEFAADTPAWSPSGTELAYIELGSDRPRYPYPPGLWVYGLAEAGITNTQVTDLPAAAPRWAPTGDRLAFIRRGAVMTVAAAENSRPTAVPGVANATAVAWQPCKQDTASCRSVLPPVCTATAAQVTTQADVPVELPAAPCSDPAGLPLRFVLDTDVEHGSLAGAVYTPRPGFVGQDSVSYRVSNGTAQSDLVRVTIFVVPRPTPLVPGADNPAPVTLAPYLSLRVKPKLDRKRRALARFACDQKCTFTVRLEAKLRSKKQRTIKGKRLKRTLEPGRVLALRVKLPAKPKGTLRSAWITGTVRGAGGVSRTVKLPVTVRR